MHSEPCSPPGHFQEQFLPLSDAEDSSSSCSEYSEESQRASAGMGHSQSPYSLVVRRPSSSREAQEKKPEHVFMPLDGWGGEYGGSKPDSLAEKREPLKGRVRRWLGKCCLGCIQQFFFKNKQ